MLYVPFILHIKLIRINFLLECGWGRVSIQVFCTIVFLFLKSSLKDFIILIQWNYMDERQCCALSPPQRWDFQKHQFYWDILYIPIKCTHFSALFSEFWQMHIPIWASPLLRQNIFTNPKISLRPIRSQFPWHPGVGKNWEAFCHSRLVLPFLEFQRNWIVYSCVSGCFCSTWCF